MKTRSRTRPVICHDCGAKEGELHKYGCDMERCPFCGGQLFSCNCAYEKLGPKYGFEFIKPIIVMKGEDMPEIDRNIYSYEQSFDHCTVYNHPTAGLPEYIYYEGMSDDMDADWTAMLEAKGRIPYIQYPQVCFCCGKLWPKFFFVSDEEWKHYIEPKMRQSIICKRCYNKVKRLIDKGEANEKD